MPKKSDYLRLAKTLGSSLLLGVTAFVWAAAFSKADWRGLSGLVAFSLVLCFLLSSEKPSRNPLLLLMAAASLGGAVYVSVVSVRFDTLGASYIVMLFPLSAGSILWQRQITGYGRRRGVYLAFLLAALPAVFAPSLLLSGLGAGGLLSLGLLMTLGSTLYLWGESEGDFREHDHTLNLRKTFPTWVIFTSAAVVLGVSVYLIAPLAFAAARTVIALTARAFGWVLVKVLEPTGFIAEYLINLLRSLAKNAEDMPEQGFRPGKLEPQPGEPYETPVALTVIGYILLAIFCLAALWLLWKALKNRAGKDTTEPSDEVSSDWSGQRAIQWVLDAGKDLLASVADFAGNLFGGTYTPKDPLLAAYSDFLSVAKEAGRKREPHETPMEFGEALASLLPGVSPQIISVSKDFSKFYYAKITPSGRDIAAMRVNIDSVKAHVSSIVSGKTSR